jgi:hypothetical protein
MNVINKATYSEPNPPWDGDLSKIPEKGTLVSIDTASSGLTNRVVEGYTITWYGETPQIRIQVEGNEMFLEQIEPPLAVREKQLIEQLGRLG